MLIFIALSEIHLRRIGICLTGSGLILGSRFSRFGLAFAAKYVLNA